MNDVFRHAMHLTRTLFYTVFMRVRFSYHGEGGDEIAFRNRRAALANCGAKRHRDVRFAHGSRYFLIGESSTAFSLQSELGRPSALQLPVFRSELGRPSWSIHDVGLELCLWEHSLSASYHHH